MDSRPVMITPPIYDIAKDPRDVGLKPTIPGMSVQDERIEPCPSEVRPDASTDGKRDGKKKIETVSVERYNGSVLR